MKTWIVSNTISNLRQTSLNKVFVFQVGHVNIDRSWQYGRVLAPFDHSDISCSAWHCARVHRNCVRLQLFCGLQNGVQVVSTVDQIAGHISDARKRYVASRAKLFMCTAPSCCPFLFWSYVAYLLSRSGTCRVVLKPTEPKSFINEEGSFTINVRVGIFLRNKRVVLRFAKNGWTFSVW